MVTGEGFATAMGRHHLAWVGAKAACDVELTYRVDFSFGRKKWPAGNEQVALLIDRSIYTTGLPLFVLGAGERPAVVRFEIPDQWQVSTPWALTGAPLEYLAPDRKTLLEASVLLHRPPPSQGDR